MELCINEMMIKNGDLLSHLEACAGCGVKYMEVSKGQLLSYLRGGGTLSELRQELAQHDITPVCINSVESISFNGKRGLRVLKEATEYLCYCSREIGCDCVEVIGSFKVPTGSWEEIHEETVQSLRELSDVAKPYRVKLALEYMGIAGSSVCTFRQAKSIIDAVGRDNVGILLDTWHHYAMGSHPEDILQAKGSDIFMVHVSDCPERAPGTALRTESCLPGEGVVPIRELLDHLTTIGYTGTVSAEIFSPAIREMPPAQLIATVRESMRQVLR